MQREIKLLFQAVDNLKFDKKMGEELQFKIHKLNTLKNEL